MRFLLITLAGIIGNGLGAWNIRTITSGRYWATAALTFSAATINMAAIRQIAAAVTGWYIPCWALGSTVGILLSIWLDRKYFHKDFKE